MTVILNAHFVQVVGLDRCSHGHNLSFCLERYINQTIGGIGGLIF